MYTQGYVFASDRIWFKMPAYSASFIGKDIEDGDKIYLPSSILDALMRRFSDRSLPNPIHFELNNNNAARTTHCGVLEFTSPTESAFLPRWMMENLLLNEGGEVRLKVKDLHKITEVKLKPVEYEFTTLPAPKYTLEHALRKFTALTVGDTILIMHNNQSYHLIVEYLQPKTTYPNAGSVVNTSLTVDFSEPVQKSSKTIVEEKLEWETLKEGTVGADSYHYYRFKYEKEDKIKHIKVECKASKGSNQPDFYISTTQTKPSMIDSMWKSSIRTGSTLILNPSSLLNTSSTSSLLSPSSSPTSTSSLNASVQWFYLSVHAYKQPASYSLIITKIDPSPYAVTPLSSSPPSVYPNLLSSSPPPTNGTSNPSSSPPVGGAAQLGSLIFMSGQSPPSTDMSYCSNCRQYIAKKQFTLHSVQCSRVNVWCASCGSIIKKTEQATHKHCPTCNIALHQDELAKHIDLVHSSVTCECGQTMPVTAIELHKTNDCPLRLVACRYCSVSLPFKDIPGHEIYCGSKTIPCELCSAPVARKKMNIHLAAVHGINPSLRPGGAYGKDPAAQAAHSLQSTGNNNNIISDDWPEVNRGVGSRGWSSRSPTVNEANSNPRGGGNPPAGTIRTPYTTSAGPPVPYGNHVPHSQNNLVDDDDAILQAVMEESRLTAEREKVKSQQENNGVHATQPTSLSTATSISTSVSSSGSSNPPSSGIDSRARQDDSASNDWPDDNGGSGRDGGGGMGLEGEDDFNDDEGGDENINSDEEADGWSIIDSASPSRLISQPLNIPHSTAATVSSKSGGSPRRDPVLCPYCHTEWPDLDSMAQHMQVCEEMQE